MPANSDRLPTLFISNIPWDFVWQRHQTLASLFARDGEVVFCELPGVRRVGWRDLGRIWRRLRQLTAERKMKDAAALPERLRIVRPFVLPSTNGVFCALNAWLLRRFLTREPSLGTGVDLIVNYSAARAALQLIDRVKARRLVYDCTDDWLAVNGVPSFLAADERALLQRADLVMVPSRALAARKAPDSRRLERVPHGGLIDRFQVEARPYTAGAPVTLLYYGHLHVQHFDFVAIEELARARPAWTILLVGPIRTIHHFPANVRQIGHQPHERLRNFVQQSDVLLLPYILNEYTKAVLPAKIYECLATGRPIVASRLPELVEDFPQALEFASDSSDWVRAVESALLQTDAQRRDRMAVAKANTWERRYQEIRTLIDSL